MADLAHKRTDDILIALEKKFEKIYKQAYKEVAAKAQAYFDGFKKREAIMRQKVKAGKMTESDFNEWRRRQMVMGERWREKCAAFAADLTNVNQIAAEMVRGEMEGVFALNANYAAYTIENNARINYGFPIHNQHTISNLILNDPGLIPWKPVVDVPADKRWNRAMITHHITQGILQGESIPNLAKRLMQTVHNDELAAVRTARTAVTAAENAGRQMVYDEAHNMGIVLEKEWMATLDARTRSSHGAADGQRVPLNKPFIVNGHSMMCPGDASAPAGERYNCRCTMRTIEPPKIEQGDEKRMTYDKWVKTKEAQDEIEAKRHRDYLKQKRRKKQKEKGVD